MITTTDFEILPELRDCLPRPTKDERERLKESIAQYGTLQGIILCRIGCNPQKFVLDGHTRIEIVNELGMYVLVHSDDFLHFDTVDEAICWIIEHQAARRNLTEVQLKQLIAKHYKANKKPWGGAEYRNGSVAQNDPSITTAEKTAKEFGVSSATVKRAVAESEKIEAAGLTSAVMDGTVKKIESAALEEIAEAVEAEPEKKEEIVQRVVEEAKANNGQVKAKRKPKPKPKPVAEDQPEEQLEEDADPEMDELFDFMCQRMTETIFRVRTEWPETYVKRLAMHMQDKFLCAIPLEWMEA